MCGVVSLLLLMALPPEAPAPEPPRELSLPELVREALEHNPEVLVAARALEAKRARVPQAAALPDPMLTYGVVNERRPVPFQTIGESDFSEAYLGLSQEIPFPGKRGLRREVAQQEAEAAVSAYEAVRRRVAADVADAYYDLSVTYASLDSVEAGARLLEQLVKVANTRLSVGQASQQDVLDAELEVSRVEERRSQLGERRSILEARIARLLCRAGSEPLGRPSPLTPGPAPGPLSDLLRRAEEESPTLREKLRLAAQGERLVDLANRERTPDFSVSFTYHNRGSLDPMYSFGGTVTLPNLHGRQKHALQEAVAGLGGARGAADQARAEVRFAVTEAFQMASTADRLLRLYDDGILKQARLSLDSAMAQYRVGKVEFTTLMASWRRLLDYELSYQEQQAAREKALSRLAVHVGPTPAPAGH